MTAEEFATLLTFALAMSFTPGPNTLLATALAANFGMRGTLRFILAVPAGWTLMMLACGLGLGALVLAVPGLRLAVKAVGVLYLVWLAWKLAAVRSLASAPSPTRSVGFWEGVALQFVNVKAWMLALAIAAGWVTSSAGHAASNPGERLAIVCALMALLAFSSNAVYAWLGAALRGWLAQGRRLLAFNRAMAMLLLATALWMLAA